MIKLRLQGSLAACVRKADATTSGGAGGDQVPGTPQDLVVDLDARTVAEALRLVGPQAPGFAEALEFGRWRITVDGAPLRSERELDMRLSDRAYVSIAPALSGEGPAIGAAAWWIIGISAAAAIYAVTQIPSIPDTDHLEEPGSRRTLFSGPVNSVAQGGAVPLIYGRTRVGSTVVSGGITQERPTGGEHAEPPDLGLGGDRPPGAERPGRGDRGRDQERRRVPSSGGDASLERSVLRVVDLLGEGEIEGLADGLKSVVIDGIPVEDADGARDVEGVTVIERKGLRHGAPGQPPLVGFDATSTGLGHPRVELEHGDPVVRAVPAGYDAVRVTLRWPRLVAYDEKGGEVAAEVQFRIESRPLGGGWTTVLTQTMRDKSLDEQERSWRLERPESVDESGTWQIRVSRLTPAPTSTRTADATYWWRSAGLRDLRQSYPHSAVIGLVIESDRSDVNPTRREYEVLGRKVLAPPASVWNPNAPTATSAASYGAGLWDGTMRRVWTDNPAWIAYDLLTDRRAGVGGTPGMVDAVRSARAGFLELSRRCDGLVPAPSSAAGMEPRWRFNGTITRREQARKVIDWLLSACRAGSSWSGGEPALAIDGESDVSAEIGAGSVIDGEFEYSGLRWQERYSAVAVTWQDPEDDYRSGIELVVADSLVLTYGYRQKDVAAVGCTSRGQAHRTGLLALSDQEAESETVRFRMALEGMHLRPGERIRIADQNRFEARASWRVLLVAQTGEGELLKLDAPSPRLVAGGRIAFGAGQSAAVKLVTYDDNVICLAPADSPTGLVPGDLVLNDAADTEWIVTRLNERDQVEVQVEARRYSSAKYTAVEQRRELAPPPVNPVAKILPPTAVTAVERTYADGNLVRSRLEIGVQGGDDPRIAQVEVEIQRPLRRATPAEIAAGDWSVLPRGPWEALRITTGRSFVERDVALGGYRLRARFRGRRRRSGWTLSAELAADGKTDALAAPEGLAAEGALGGYWVHWPRPEAADYAYTEVYDRDGQPGPANADVDVEAAGWTLRGSAAGTGFRRADVSDTEPLRVAVRHVDTSGKASPAREVGVTPLEVIEGADGADGVGVEYAFLLLANDVAPAIPAGADDWLYDRPEDGWTDGSGVGSPATPFLQRIRRPVAGAPAAGESPLDADGNRRPGWGGWRLDGRWLIWGRDGEPGIRGLAGYSSSLSRSGRAASVATLNSARWHLSGTAEEWTGARTLRIGGVSAVEEVQLGLVDPGGLVTLYAHAEHWADYRLVSVAFADVASRRDATISLLHVESVGAQPASGAIALHYTPRGGDGADGLPGLRGLAGYSTRIARSTRAAEAASADTNAEWFLGGSTAQWSGGNRTLQLGGVTEAEEAALGLIEVGGLLTIYVDAANWGDYRLTSRSFAGAGATRTARVRGAYVESVGVPATAGGMALHFTEKGKDGRDGEPGIRGLAGYSSSLSRSGRAASVATLNSARWHLSGTAEEWTGARTLRIGGVSAVEEVQLGLVDPGGLVTLYADAEHWADYRLVSVAFADVASRRDATISLLHVESVGAQPASGPLTVRLTPRGVGGDDGAGVEDVFRTLAANQDPAIPAGADDWLYDRPEDGWTDGVTGLSPATPWIQRLTRAVGGHPAAGVSPLDADGARKPGWGSWRLSGRWRGYAVGEQAREVSVVARTGGAGQSSATTSWRNPQTPPVTWRIVVRLGLGKTPQLRSRALRYVAAGAANAAQEHTESFVSPAAEAGDLVDVEVSPAAGTAPNYQVDGGQSAQAVAAAPALGVPSPTVNAGDAYLDVMWSHVSGRTAQTTYEIWYGSGSNNPGTPQITGVAGTARRITGLQNGVRQWIRVRARLGATVSSWSSSFISGTPEAAAAPPGRPTNVRLTADDHESASGSWGPPNDWGTGATRRYFWELWVGTAMADSGYTAATFRAFASLTANTTYTLRVYADTSVGRSSSRSDTATTSAPPVTGAGLQHFVGAKTTGAQFPTAVRRRWDGSAWGAWSGVNPAVVPGYHYTTTDLDETAIETSGHFGRWITAPANGPPGLFSRGIHGVRGSRMGIREDYPNSGVYVRLTSNLTWFSTYGNSEIAGALDDLRGGTANWGFYTGAPPTGFDFDTAGGWFRWEPD